MAIGDLGDGGEAHGDDDGRAFGDQELLIGSRVLTLEPLGEQVGGDTVALGHGEGAGTGEADQSEELEQW